MRGDITDNDRMNIFLSELVNLDVRGDIHVLLDFFALDSNVVHKNWTLLITLMVIFMLVVVVFFIDNAFDVVVGVRGHGLITGVGVGVGVSLAVTLT